MNTKHILIYFMIFCFMQSCNNSRKHHYSLNDIPDIINISTVKTLPVKTSHIKYIPLETSNECLIGYVNKIMIRNNLIYVADFNQAKALFIFDIDGKFIFKIDRKGRGPGEYISFHDFDVQSNGNIYMYDNHGWKFLLFNSTGEYLMDIKTQYSLSHFCLAGTKMYWSQLVEGGKMISNLAVYDMEKKTTDFLFTEKKHLYPPEMLRFSSYNFYYSPNNIYYSPKFSEIIYSINEEGILPAIGIKNLQKPPEYMIEQWAREKNPHELIKSIMNDKYFIENIYIYETENYISFGCIIGFFTTILYNKHTKEAFKVLTSDYYQTIGRDGIMGSTGKDFFSIIDFDSENHFHKQILKERQELKNWKEEDNPVVVIFNLDM